MVFIVASLSLYGHDLVVQAVKSEVERCGLSVDTSDKSLRRNFSHAGSQHRGDGVVHGNGDLQVKDEISRSRVLHDDFVFDVTVDSAIKGTGVWTGSRDRQTQKWKHTALACAENEKYRKHEEGYANVSLGFLAFAVSSFGVLGDGLVRFLFVLARLEARKISQHLQQHGGAPLSDAAMSQTSASNFQASLARVTLAVCRATAARLTGRSSQPRVHPPPPDATFRRLPTASDFEAP